MVKTENKSTVNPELWCEFDFIANKYYWKHQEFDNEIQIRKNNLFDIFQAFKKANVQIWLQGRTLLGIYKYGAFLEDHDDDVGIWIDDIEIVRNIVLSDLKKIGFSIIRNSDSIISVLRDKRYIDICIFRKRKRKVGYANKWFSNVHFSSFENISFYDQVLTIPYNTEELLIEMYEKNAISTIITLTKKFTNKSLIPRISRKIIRYTLRNLSHPYRKVINNPLNRTGIKYRMISESEFLDTLIEPLDSFNWKWRKPHLDIITNNKTNIRIGDIVSYFKNEDNFKRVINNIKETDMSKPFFNPSNYDSRFWQTGNNFFIYCIIYQFRHNILPYSEANSYITEKKKPFLFTSEYYESKRSMTESEIKELIKSSPVEITNGAFTGGKHRALAMVGRLVSGKPYIPFWAIVKSK